MNLLELYRAFNTTQLRTSNPELPPDVLFCAAHLFLPPPWQRSICLLGLFLILPFAATGQSPGAKLWKVDAGGEIISSPALGADGTIYVAATTSASTGGCLLAISREGETLWTNYTGGNAGRSSPCIGLDGTIYVGTANGEMLAFSPAGQTNWIFRAAESKPVSSPALGVDGTIYIRGYGQRYDRLYSVSAEGATNWQIELGRSPITIPLYQMSSPAIGADGTIYVTSGSSNLYSDSSYLYAISPAGSTNWSFALGAPTYASPAVGPDGTLYLGTDKNYVYAIDPKGQLKWRYLAPGFVESSAAVGADGSVYVGYYLAGRGGLLALTQTGKRRWSLDKGTGVSASPAIDDIGNVYIAELAAGGYFRAMDSLGSNIWSYPLAFDTPSSPVISPDGTLYIGTGRSLYALVGGRPLMQSAWPMFHGGPRHTARAHQLGIQCSPPLRDGSIELLMRTEIDRNYQVLCSTNLLDWSVRLKFTSTNWNPTIKIPAGSWPQEFFRLQSP